MASQQPQDDPNLFASLFGASSSQPLPSLEEDNDTATAQQPIVFHMPVPTSLTSSVQMRSPLQYTDTSSMDYDDQQSISTASSSTRSVGRDHAIESLHMNRDLPSSPTPLPDHRHQRQIWAAIRKRAEQQHLKMTTLTGACYLTKGLAHYIFQSLSYTHPYSWWLAQTQFDYELQSTYHVTNAAIIDTFRKLTSKNSKFNTRLVAHMPIDKHDVLQPFCDFYLNAMCNTTFSANHSSVIEDAEIIQSGAQLWYHEMQRVKSNPYASHLTRLVTNNNGKHAHFYVFMCSYVSLTMAHAQLRLEDKFMSKKPLFGILLFMCCMWLTYRTPLKRGNLGLTSNLFKTICSHLLKSVVAAKGNVKDDTFRSSQHLFSMDENLAMMMCHLWRLSFLQPIILNSNDELLGESLIEVPLVRWMCATVKTATSDTTTNMMLAINEWLNALICFVFADMVHILAQPCLDYELKYYMSFKHELLPSSKSHGALVDYASQILIQFAHVLNHHCVSLSSE